MGSPCADSSSLSCLPKFRSEKGFSDVNYLSFIHLGYLHSIFKSQIWINRELWMKTDIDINHNLQFWLHIFLEICLFPRAIPNYVQIGIREESLKPTYVSNGQVSHDLPVVGNLLHVLAPWYALGATGHPPEDTDALRQWHSGPDHQGRGGHSHSTKFWDSIKAHVNGVRTVILEHSWRGSQFHLKWINLFKPYWLNDCYWCTRPSSVSFYEHKVCCRFQCPCGIKKAISEFLRFTG